VRDLLPVELYRNIAEDVTREDLHSMARSCRMLQPEAERILWRKIVLARTVTVIPFCRRLSATPRLAQYVLELNIGFFEDYNHKTELQIFPQTLRRVISRLLEQTTGLRVLNLHISYFRTETDHLRVDTCGSLFDHCTFKLHHFASEFVLDDRLISFLETQPDIRILALLVAKDTEALLPLHVLSKLASFGSNQFDTLLYVLRHWSITHVALPTFGSAACLSRIAQSTHTIKVLNLCCYHATLSELCNLENNFLPNLELLCGLQMSYDHVSIGVFAWPDNY
jgi:hypothetical protein